MGRALSMDLREPVLKACGGGLSARGAADRFGVSASTAIRWVQRARQGETEPCKTGRKHASALDVHEAFIIDLIEVTKDITLNKTVAQLHDERGLLVSRSGLNVWLRKHGFTYKKVRTRIEAELSRRLETAVGLARRAVGPRLHKACLYRRNGLLHQDGPPERPLAMR